MTGQEKLVISGGALTRDFFKEAFELCGLSKPRVLIDRFASPNPRIFNNNFDGILTLLHDMGARTSLLQNDFEDTPRSTEAIEKVHDCDIVYIHGGSTKRLAEKWRQLELDKHVMSRVSDGSLVGTGASAGALIWFQVGHSDSREYEVSEDERWNYIRVPGTAILPYWATVHYEKTDVFGRQRSESFRSILRRHTDEWETAIGLETRASLICSGGIARVRDIRSEVVGTPQTAYLIDHGKYVGTTALGQNEEFSLI